MTMRFLLRVRFLLLSLIANALIAAGVLGLGVYAVTKVDALFYGRLENSAFDRLQPDLPSEPTESVPQRFEPALPSEWTDHDVTPSILPKPVIRSREARRSLGQGQALGRLEIQRIQVSALIFEGLDERTLLHGLGHITETALPGGLGNFAVAGHRDTVFRNLRSIANGDVIRITTQQAAFRYVVTSIAVVSPEDITPLLPTSKPTCTLITCFPFSYFGSAPKRFIVQAEKY